MRGSINSFVSIYVLLHPQTREIKYVGLSRNPKRRFQDHCYGRSTNQINKWVQNLTEFPVMKIQEVVPETEADERERFWISYFRGLGLNLLNQTDGGECGYKMSYKKRGHRGPHKPTSPETREKIRLSHLGKSLSPEHAAAIRAGWTADRRQAQSVIMAKIYLDKKLGLR